MLEALTEAPTGGSITPIHHDLRPYEALERLQKLFKRYRQRWSPRTKSKIEITFSELNQLLDYHADQRAIGVSLWGIGMGGQFGYVYRISTEDVPNLYVGKTTDYMTRRNTHIDRLRFAHEVGPMMCGTRPARPYSAKIFVVEVCPEWMLSKREQHWIDAVGPVMNKRRAFHGWAR